jgi:transcriptional regulator with XRE-family HTH domain
MKMGNNLKRLRIAAELTQEELALKLNMTKSNISKYERGDLEPNLATLNMLAKIFGVSVDSILGIADEFVPIQKAKSDNPLQKQSRADSIDWILPSDPKASGRKKDEKTDREIISIQRMYQDLPDKGRDKFMKLLRITFDEIFPKEDEEDDIQE